jgi:hypothetical protein
MWYKNNGNKYGSGHQLTFLKYHHSIWPSIGGGVATVLIGHFQPADMFGEKENRGVKIFQFAHLKCFDACEETRRYVSPAGWRSKKHWIKISPNTPLSLFINYYVAPNEGSAVLVGLINLFIIIIIS